MRDDLSDAYAAIDWANSQLPILEQMIESWRQKNAYAVIEEPHPEMGQKLFKLRIDKMFPPSINAGVGAVINSIRTSLDLLGAALAARNGQKASRDTHFPIYTSVTDFWDPLFAAKRKRWLSAVELKIVENLKPYRGGNDFLFALHHFDIVRKHERLIGVHLFPTSASLSPEARAAGVTLAGVWPGFKDDAVIATAPIDAPQCNFQITASIAFDETEFLTNQPILPTLRQFTGLADSIVQRFERT